MVVYQTSSAIPGLLITRPGDVLPRDLVVADSSVTDPVMSADGTRVLFRSPGNLFGQNPAGLQQAWISDTATGEVRRVTSDPAGIAEATLSGNGEVAWAVTYAGRLLKVGVETGEAREVVPQTTALDQSPLDSPIRAAAGALVWLTGRGLAADYAASGLPLAAELSGLRLVADGRPLPLVSVSPSGVLFQVPWDLTGTVNLALAPGDSPFEDQLTRRPQVLDTALETLRTPDGSIATGHGDFSGLVTANNPARPREAVHLYVTGMGAVSPAVPTGEPAPAAPLSTVTGPVFSAWGGNVVGRLPTPQIPFSGWAPGMVGVHQVSIVLPEDFSPSEFGLTIQAGDSSVFVTIPVGS